MNFLIDDSRVILAGQCALVYLLLSLTIKVTSLVWRRFLASPINIKQKYAGKWALVTGSTDGIGKAYSFALAKSNMNIVLVSRTQSKLDLTASEISKKFPSGNKNKVTANLNVFCNSYLEGASWYVLLTLTFLYLAQVKTIAVDFVNDDEITYRLKIAREIEGKSEMIS